MSEITPEKAAAAVCEGVGGWMESLEAALSVTAQGNVLSLEVTRWDGPEDSENVRCFRAVVVEGEQAPIVLPAGAVCDYINGDDGYRWLTCGTCEESLMEVKAGSYFAEMADKIAAHKCSAEASQAKQETP